MEIKNILWIGSNEERSQKKQEVLKRNYPLVFLFHHRTYQTEYPKEVPFQFIVLEYQSSDLPANQDGYFQCYLRLRKEFGRDMPIIILADYYFVHPDQSIAKIEAEFLKAVEKIIS